MRSNKLYIYIYMHAQLLNQVGFFVTPWTIATRLLCPEDFPGKNTEVGCHFLLQRIFWIQTLKPGLLHFLNWQADFIRLCHLGSPDKLLHTHYFSSHVSCPFADVKFDFPTLSLKVLKLENKQVCLTPNFQDSFPTKNGF